MINKGLVSVPDSARRDAGLVTWWTLSGNIRVDTLRKAWLEAGYDEEDLPSLPGESTLLRRALLEHAHASSDRLRTMVRPLTNGEFAVVRETLVGTADDRGVEYETLFKAWVDSDCALTDSNDETVCDAVDILFDQARRVYESTDLSGWFIAQVEKHSAVGLRDRGGIYFVPQPEVQSWNTFADLITKVSSCRIYEIPAMRTERAVGAVLDAVTREAEAMVANMQDAIASGNLGTRALATKKQRCEVMEAKVAGYEALLGVKMSALQGKLEELRAATVAAIIVAESEAA